MHARTGGVSEWKATKEKVGKGEGWKNTQQGNVDSNNMMMTINKTLTQRKTRGGNEYWPIFDGSKKQKPNLIHTNRQLGMELKPIRNTTLHGLWLYLFPDCNQTQAMNDEANDHSMEKVGCERVEVDR